MLINYSSLRTHSCTPPHTDPVLRILTYFRLAPIAESPIRISIVVVVMTWALTITLTTINRPTIIAKAVVIRIDRHFAKATIAPTNSTVR